MKMIKQSLLSLLLVSLFFVGTATASQAVEMEVDVGIEFTDIEPEPTPDPKPDPIPSPAPKPPLQKIIQLPQTGESQRQGFTIAGALLMSGAGIVIYQRKRGVAKE